MKTSGTSGEHRIELDPEEIVSVDEHAVLEEDDAVPAPRPHLTLVRSHGEVATNPSARRMVPPPPPGAEERRLRQAIQRKPEPFNEAAALCRLLIKEKRFQESLPLFQQMIARLKREHPEEKRALFDWQISYAIVLRELSEFHKGLLNKKGIWWRQDCLIKCTAVMQPTLREYLVSSFEDIIGCEKEREHVIVWIKELIPMLRATDQQKKIAECSEWCALLQSTPQNDTSPATGGGTRPCLRLI